MAIAIVNNNTGRVKTFVRDDIPEGYSPPIGYSLIPDDELPQGWEREPEILNPDWQGFMNRLDLATDNNPSGTGLFEAMRAINEILAWQGRNVCVEFKNGLAGEQEIRTLTFIYLQFVPLLTVEQVGLLQSALTDFSIPVQIS